jgi:hypothetical protein
MLEGNAQDPLQLQASNLSLGGMFVQAGAAPAMGTRVALTLEAAGRWLDFAEAEVAWVGTRGFGVRFTNLRPRARALIEHLVARGGTGETSPRRGPHGSRLALGAAVVLGVTCAGMVGLQAWSRARAHHAVPVAPVVAQAAPTVAPPATPPVVPTMSVVPELTAQRPVEAAPKVFPGEFQFTLPTGGVSALRITINDHEVVVLPSLRKGAVIRKVFDLPHPARLVIDVGGREPKYSWQLEGTTVVKSVRIGARNHGTRVVVDLPDSLDPKHTSYRVVPPTGGV